MSNLEKGGCVCVCVRVCVCVWGGGGGGVGEASAHPRTHTHTREHKHTILLVSKDINSAWETRHSLLHKHSVHQRIHTAQAPGTCLFHAQVNVDTSSPFNEVWAHPAEQVSDKGIRNATEEAGACGSSIPHKLGDNQYCSFVIRLDLFQCTHGVREARDCRKRHTHPRMQYVLHSSGR